MKKTKGRKIVDNLTADANKIAVVIKDNPGFTISDDVGLKEFQAAIKELEDSDSEFVSKDIELTAAKNTRKDKISALRTLVTRARKGFYSQFGPDSTQYQQSGCKRVSDRKKPARRNGNGNGQPHA